MLQLLALAISRRHSPFFINTLKTQRKTTALAIQLAGAIPDTPNSSLVDTLACSIIQTRPQLLIRTWDSHTATTRLLSDLFGLFESQILSQSSPAPRLSGCLNGKIPLNTS